MYVTAKIYTVQGIFSAIASIVCSKKGGDVGVDCTRNSKNKGYVGRNPKVHYNTFSEK